MTTRSARLVRDESGYATVAAAFVIAAIAAAVVMVMFVGSAVLARHRAQSAADLAALAAGVEAVAGASDPCGAAAALLRAQTPPVSLSDCRVEGEDVVVSAEVTVHLGRFGVRSATARARAGPVT